jgi:hypothetical protein
MTLPVEDMMAYRSLELALSGNDHDSIADILPHFWRFQPGVGTGANLTRSKTLIELCRRKPGPSGPG